jgi:L,D-transpeptidase YcbB
VNGVPPPSPAVSRESDFRRATAARFFHPLVTGDQGQLLLQQLLEQLYFDEQDSIGKEPAYTAGYLLDLYRKNQFNPLWTSQDNINQLLSAIVAGADEGLIPDDYHLKALIRYGDELKESPSLAKLVEYDLLLSDALVLLGQHKQYGKVDSRKVEEKKNLEATTPRPSPIDTYLTAIKSGTVRATLDKLSPHHQSYISLKQALSQYKAIAGKKGWQQIPAGQSLRPGMRDERVSAIRHRLAVTGEYHRKGSNESMPVRRPPGGRRSGLSGPASHGTRWDSRQGYDQGHERHRGRTNQSDPGQSGTDTMGYS